MEIDEFAVNLNDCNIGANFLSDQVKCLDRYPNPMVCIVLTVYLSQALNLGHPNPNSGRIGSEELVSYEPGNTECNEQSREAPHLLGHSGMALVWGHMIHRDQWHARDRGSLHPNLVLTGSQTEPTNDAGLRGRLHQIT